MEPKGIIDLLKTEYGVLSRHQRRDPTDELILTVLSQNTSDVNSGRAFARLKSVFPDWQALMTADIRQVESAIRPGGLGPTKAVRIQALLGEVWQRRDSFGLSFLGGLPLEEAKLWLESLPGVGPKTAACVLLFSLDRPALPIDTHVHRVARRLGLVPAKAAAERAQEMLEERLKPQDVYPFHVYLIEHGRRTCLAQRPRCRICVLRRGCPSASLFEPS